MDVVGPRIFALIDPGVCSSDGSRELVSPSSFGKRAPDHCRLNESTHSLREYTLSDQVAKAFAARGTFIAKGLRINNECFLKRLRGTVTGRRPISAAVFALVIWICDVKRSQFGDGIGLFAAPTYRLRPEAE